MDNSSNSGGLSNGFEHAKTNLGDGNNHVRTAEIHRQHVARGYQRIIDGLQGLLATSGEAGGDFATMLVHTREADAMYLVATEATIDAAKGSANPLLTNAIHNGAAASNTLFARDQSTRGNSPHHEATRLHMDEVSAGLRSALVAAQQALGSLGLIEGDLIDANGRSVAAIGQITEYQQQVVAGTAS